MLKKIADIHQKNYGQLKSAWIGWSPEMKKKAKVAFDFSIKEWNLGIKMLREQSLKEENETKKRTSKRKKTGK